MAVLVTSLATYFDKETEENRALQLQQWQTAPVPCGKNVYFHFHIF
jgi:hypothetical protein